MIQVCELMFNSEDFNVVNRPFSTRIDLGVKITAVIKPPCFLVSYTKNQGNRNTSIIIQWKNYAGTVGFVLLPSAAMLEGHPYYW